jgi:hypothetical protein
MNVPKKSKLLIIWNEWSTGVKVFMVVMVLLVKILILVRQPFVDGPEKQIKHPTR